MTLFRITFFGVVLLALVAAVRACGRDHPREISFQPGLELALEAGADWNEACGIELFRPGFGDVRFRWADSLGQGRLSYRAAAVLVAEDTWDAGCRSGACTEADHRAILGHELGHVLMSGFGGTDGFGHYDGGIMARQAGADRPTAADVETLRSLGYPCKQR